MASASTDATTQRGTRARAVEPGAPLRRVLVEFRYRLFFTYSLFAVEMLALLLLFLYDRSVVGICLAVLVPVILLGRRYGRRAVQLNLEQYDELERQVDVISRRNAEEIDLHFRRLRMWQVRLSDQEVWNFGATELLVLVAISGSLLVAAEPGHAVVQVGATVGIYNYILKFASGLETIPYMIQRLGALKDILRRMSEVASDGADAPRDMPNEPKRETSVSALGPSPNSP